jgi:hypothetical protein
MTWRAAGIESCRKPAVEVTISTRGAAPDVGDGWTAVGDAGELFDEHAPPTTAKRTRARRRGSHKEHEAHEVKEHEEKQISLCSFSL